MTQIANIVSLLRDYEYRESLTFYSKQHRVLYKVIELLNDLGVIQKINKNGIKYRIFRCIDSNAAAEHIVYINYFRYLLNNSKVSSLEEIDNLHNEIITRKSTLKKLFDLNYDRINMSFAKLTHRIVNPLTGEVIAAFNKLEDYNAMLPIFERIYGLKFEGDLQFILKNRIAETQVIN